MEKLQLRPILVLQWEGKTFAPRRNRFLSLPPHRESACCFLRKYNILRGNNQTHLPLSTPLLRYWNRTSGTTGASDELTASVLFIRNGEQGAAPVAIVALDLVGVAHETSTKIASIVKEACGNNPAVETFVACSHTHTGPQSHSDLKGMSQGGAAYIEGTLDPPPLSFVLPIRK